MSTFNFYHMFFLTDLILKISNVFGYSGSSSIVFKNILLHSSEEAIVEICFLF